MCACALAGFAVFKTYDTDGKLSERLRENARELQVIATEAIQDVQDRTAKSGSSGDWDEESQVGSETRMWTELRHRVDEVRNQLFAEDGTAEELLEKLEADLEYLKRYSSEKSSEAIAAATEKVELAKLALKDDAREAGRELRELSEDLGEQARESILSGNSDD